MNMIEVNSPQPEEHAALPGAPTDSPAMSSASKKKADDEYSKNLNRCLSALEHPTVKVPYECLNRRFRTAQKMFDREAMQVGCHAMDSKESIPKINSCNYCTTKVTSIIKVMKDQVSSFKRKAKEAIAGEVEYARVVKRRVEHLQDGGKGNDAEKNSWERTRFDRLLTDYLLREGCYDTARKLVETRNIHDLTNLDIFQTAYDVEKSLQKKDVSKCLAWCHENKSKLKRLSSNLEFNLRIQEYIEMVKKDERMSAVWHARKYFTTADSEQLASIQQCMALLAFSPDTNIPEYQSLLSESRWESLIVQFRSENLRIFQLSPQSSFNAVLQAGLSALKTPQCYTTSKDSFNADCPVCLPHLNYLAKDLPYAHCSQSRMVCGMSGERMNENNQPLMLPNGHVYGTNAIEAMALENNGVITCPRTQATCKLIETKKVFVM